MAEYRHYHAGSLINLANYHHDRGERAEARRLLEEAMPHHRAAIQSRPLHASYRKFLCANRVSFAQTFLTEKDYAGLAGAAEQLAEAAAEAAGQSAEVSADFRFELTRAAVFLAKCATMAGQDDRLPEARRAELDRTYTEQAMATLRLAVKLGYRDTATLKRQVSFAPMLSRPDFQNLLAEMEKTQKMP